MPEKQKDRRISGGLGAFSPFVGERSSHPGGAPEGRWLPYGFAENSHEVEMAGAVRTFTRA